jgi:putative Mg2+ transporter-C (MgtC) family protein
MDTMPLPLDQAEHAISAAAASLGHTGELFLRLFLAGVAGGLVGLERELRGRQAGFRTNILVCLGSALTMLVSIHFASHPWPPDTGQAYQVRVDPARIAYGVMTGVGFLGAGAIVRHGGSVRGLTTAAAMWCVAAVGLAIGFGMYLVSFGAVFFIVAALWFLDYLEDRLPKVRYRTVTVRRRWAVGCIDSTIRRFKEADLDVVDASFDRTSDLSCADIHLTIAFINKYQYYTFERQLEGDSEMMLLSTRER